MSRGRIKKELNYFYCTLHENLQSEITVRITVTSYNPVIRQCTSLCPPHDAHLGMAQNNVSAPLTLRIILIVVMARWHVYMCTNRYKYIRYCTATYCELLPWPS